MITSEIHPPTCWAGVRQSTELSLDLLSLNRAVTSPSEKKELCRSCHNAVLQKAPVSAVFPVAVRFLLCWWAVALGPGHGAGVSKQSPKAQKSNGERTRKFAFLCWQFAQHPLSSVCLHQRCTAGASLSFLHCRPSSRSPCLLSKLRTWLDWVGFPWSLTESCVHINQCSLINISEKTGSGAISPGDYTLIGWTEHYTDNNAVSNQLRSRQGDKHTDRLELCSTGRGPGQLFPQVFSSGWSVYNPRIREQQIPCAGSWPVAPPVWPSCAVTHRLSS